MLTYFIKQNLALGSFLWEEDKKNMHSTQEIWQDTESINPSYMNMKVLFNRNYRVKLNQDVILHEKRFF